MSQLPAEFTLELSPRARVDVIDVRRIVSASHGDSLNPYPRVLCCSFHTTADVLEGLRDYADAYGPRRSEVFEAESRGREFLLAHRLYRSHHTGSVVDPKMLRLSFPPRWHYDILRGLDYFRAAGAQRDARIADAIGVLMSKRRRDGRCGLQHAVHGHCGDICARAA